MFAPIVSDLGILIGINGYYWPTNTNTIGNWNPYEGYIIKVLSDVTLQICGTPVSSTSVNLSQGWNLIPVLSSVNVDIATVFGSTSCFVIAKGIPTGVYWPAFGINHIGDLEPGKAYWVYVTCDCTITFPPSPMKASSSAPKLPPSVQSPWNEVYKTPHSHLIGIDDEFAAQHYGDIIGVFNSNGVCMGLAEIEKENNVLIVFGDDPITTEIDGMLDAGQMTFKIYDPETRMESVIEPEFDTSLPEWTNEFKINGLSRISYKTSIEESFSSVSLSIYPNPARDIVNIKVNDARNGNMDIKIIDVTGRLMYMNSFSVENQISLDISHLPKGIYQLIAQFPEGTIPQKLVIN
jgi:hypothetical protein